MWLNGDVFRQVPNKPEVFKGKGTYASSWFEIHSDTGCFAYFVVQFVERTIVTQHMEMTRKYRPSRAKAFLHGYHNELIPALKASGVKRIIIQKPYSLETEKECDLLEKFLKPMGFDEPKVILLFDKEI